MKLSWFDWIVVVLVIIGGLNWGLIGVFGYNMVSITFGDASVVSRIICSLVGLSAIYLAIISPKLGKE